MNNVERNILDMLARVYAQNAVLDTKLNVLLQAHGFNQESLEEFRQIHDLALNEAAKAILRRLGKEGGGDDDEDSSQYFAPRW